MKQVLRKLALIICYAIVGVISGFYIGSFLGKIACFMLDEPYWLIAALLIFLLVISFYLLSESDRCITKGTR
jgi:ABC-type microcin C transport system permease subunit YejE